MLHNAYSQHKSFLTVYYIFCGINPPVARYFLMARTGKMFCMKQLYIGIIKTNLRKKELVTESCRLILLFVFYDIVHLQLNPLNSKLPDMRVDMFHGLHGTTVTFCHIWPHLHAPSAIPKVHCRLF